MAARHYVRGLEDHIFHLMIFCCQRILRILEIEQFPSENTQTFRGTVRKYVFCTFFHKSRQNM